MTRLILALLLASAAPSHATEACTRIDRLQMGLLAQGFTTLFVSDPGKVSQVLGILRAGGVPVEFDGFVIMPLPEGAARLTLSKSFCALGTVDVDRGTADIIHDIIGGKPEGRDA